MPGKTREELKKIGEKTRFSTGSEQVEIARKGGLASVKKRKEEKLWRDVILERLKADDMKDVVDRLIINAATNGGKDFEILRDTMGQKPVDRKEIRAEVGIEEILRGEGNEPTL